MESSTSPQWSTRQAWVRVAAALLAFGIASVTVQRLAGDSPDTKEPARQADAASIALRLDDLPDGWESETSEEFLPDEAREQLEEVRQFQRETYAARAESPLFLHLTASVTSTVWFRETEALASTEFSVFKHPTKGEDWSDIAEDLADMIPGDTEVVETTFADLAELGDEAARVRIVVDQTVGGEVTRIYTDNYIVRRGRILASMEATEAEEPFDTRLARQLLATMASRMVENPRG